MEGVVPTQVQVWFIHVHRLVRRPVAVRRDPGQHEALLPGRGRRQGERALLVGEAMLYSVATLPQDASCTFPQKLTQGPPFQRLLCAFLCRDRDGLWLPGILVSPGRAAWRDVGPLLASEVSRSHQERKGQGSVTPRGWGRG